MDTYLTPFGPTKLHVNPIFEIGHLEPRFSEWLVFEVRQIRGQHLCRVVSSAHCIRYMPGWCPRTNRPWTCMCAAGVRCWQTAPG